MKRTSIIILFLFLFIYPVYSHASTSAEKAQSTITSHKGEVIFIYASRVCGCTKRKCNLMEKELKSMQTNKKYNNIKFTKINYSENKDKAVTILKKYKMSGIPVCIIIDKEKKVKYSASSVLDKNKCPKVLDTLIKKENK